MFSLFKFFKSTPSTENTNSTENTKMKIEKDRFSYGALAGMTITTSKNLGMEIKLDYLGNDITKVVLSEGSSARFFMKWCSNSDREVDREAGFRVTGELAKADCYNANGWGFVQRYFYDEMAQQEKWVNVLGVNYIKGHLKDFRLFDLVEGRLVQMATIDDEGNVLPQKGFEKYLDIVDPELVKGRPRHIGKIDVGPDI